MRESWDKYFLDIAKVVKKRSTCLRRKVGAVIVKDNRIVGTGYNGAPSKAKDCIERGECIRQVNKIPSGERHELCRAAHAEQNAVAFCARHGTSTNGATLYTTTFPCSICAKILINAGINKIVYEKGYPDLLSKILLEETGIEIIKEVENAGQSQV